LVHIPLFLSIFWVLFFTSCRSIPLKSTLPRDVEAPRLEKTFGEVEIQSPSQFLLRYKSIVAGIDIAPSAPLDYLLITRAAPDTLSSIRKDQKILAPESQVGLLKNKGFRMVKDVRPGAMIQLTKDGGFMFVRGADSQSGSVPVKSYFFECDNGRNILIAADGVRPDDLRPFLYALRDEGKEVHLAVVPYSKDSTAETIGLFQPFQAVVTGSSGSADQVDLKNQLKEQLYSGALIFPQSGGTIPF
jgi:hypothetical protein